MLRERVCMSSQHDTGGWEAEGGPGEGRGRQEDHSGELG